MVISTIYPDGMVAAMEELIGNHGGLGGEQTDAFLLHPMDLSVPETSNSADVFNILNGRRDLAGAPAVPEKPTEEKIDAWKPSNILRGLFNVKKWLPMALGAILLQREAYRKISIDDWFTGPALLLGILGTSIFSTTLLGELNLGMLVFNIIFWFITVLIMYLAGRLLRGKGTFTSVLCAVGFAQAVLFLDIFSIIPSITPLVTFIISLVNFIALWIGVASAHELKGWKTVILPVVYILVAVAGVVIILSVFGGFKLTIGSIKIGF